MDTRSLEQRRRIMQSVGTKDTGPELIVRRLLYSLGFRYRLHGKKLPGKPDLVFASRRKAVFVHGCFWHNHECSKGRAPKSKAEYWLPKLETNRLRDDRNLDLLASQGWQSLVVWQCETKDPDALRLKLVSFLGDE
jgi:DNA mismatch endonuclease (patch repair protein)